MNLLFRLTRALFRLPRLEKVFLALGVFALISWTVERLSGFSPPLTGLARFLFLALGFVLGIKYLLGLVRRAVWSLRNRLILSYVFIGVVPIVLILAMLGIGMYVLMGQVATYLMTAEMNRRTEIVRDCAYALARNVADRPRSGNALAAANQFVQQLQDRLPKIQAVLRSDGQTFSVPADAGLTEFPHWSQEGFVGLISAGREYAIGAHIRVRQAGHDVQVFAYEPAGPDMLARLLPRLASISFVEIQDTASDGSQGAEEPSSSRSSSGPQADPLSRAAQFDPLANEQASPRSNFVLPPPEAWWDIEVRWGTPMSVRRWEGATPAQSQVLVTVVSRSSLIIRQLFSTLGPLAGSVRFVFYLIGGLFLLVEIASLIFGVGLTRTITRSVADLYEGTLKIKAGDFSKRITIRSQDQLSELAASFNQMTASIQSLIAESKEKERLESELEIAREVQSQLFPKATPRLRSLEVVGICQPARMVSGDYYDFIQLNSNWTALAIGDIAGKGISAALLMASIQSSLRAHLSSSHWLTQGELSPVAPPSTSELTGSLNHQLYESTSPEKFATFFLALYNEQTSQLFYTNAGHLPPLLLRAGQAHRLEVSGMVLGAFPNQSYERGALELEAGDLLAAYTDGITEPENEYGEEFGEKRLVELLIQNSRKPLHQIAGGVTAAVKEWSGMTEQPDDMTLLLIRRI
jgi:sigma-B regulation protein RsbU (phosphoserine phosphatase)